MNKFNTHNKGVTKRENDYSQWYLDIIEKADLAENSSVRGCMVIRPYGYAIWENIQKSLNEMICDSGSKNAYFPLFIPKSFFSREASHVKGFAKECAIVTHYRLKESADGKGVDVDPDAKLEEELIVRPTSETIIYDTFSRWITSWRDLPLKINQWANVVRWERRTRPFLRTAEFLWQEGHTVHMTHEESLKEAIDRMEMYVQFAKEFLALDVYYGKKSQMEKFAGALDTYGIEALMQDGKALQFGTSHDLGQNFSHSFNIKFVDKDGVSKYPWQTSWGVSTRMMGALIMAHSDDNGLVLPPKIAPVKIVIVPISKNENKDLVVNYANEIFEMLKGVYGRDEIVLDDRDFLSPGAKFNEWEKKGVPVRIEIGSKEVESENALLVRRDSGEKVFFGRDVLLDEVGNILNDIQKVLFERSRESLRSRTYSVKDYGEFKRVFEEENGFVLAHWCGDSECELKIKNELSVTTRCLPFGQEGKKGRCVFCGKECSEEWLFAKAY